MRWKPILAIPLIVSLSVVWLLWPYSQPEAGWYDEAYGYRQKTTIPNTGADDANKKVKLDIDTATPIAAGKMQSDCDDVRFTDINGKELKYYLDAASGACNSASTDFYVFLPTIFGSSDNVIYLYYGNPSAGAGTQSSQFAYSTFSPSSSVNYATEETGPGPVVYWPLNEGYGTTAHDRASNATNGTLTGGPVWKSEAECISGKCLFFDGSDDNVTVSAPTSVKTSTRTISFWIRPIHFNATQGIVSLGGSNYYYGITTNGRLIESHQNTSNSQITSTSPLNTLVINSWYHVAFVTTTSGSDVSTSYYVNGKFIETDTYTDGHGVLYGTNLRVAQITTNYFQGYVDEVKVYPYARSADQIKADYNARGSTQGTGVRFGSNLKQTGESLTNGLVGWWKMDEASANTCSGGVNDSCDSSGNGNDGTWTGNATSTSGRFGSGVTFDGTSDYINFADNTTHEMGTSDMSFSAWVNPTSNAASAYILRKSDAANANGYLLGVESGVVKIKLNGTTLVASSTTTLTTGQWYFIAATVDRDGRMSLYVNGVLEGFVDVSSIATTNLDTTAGLTISYNSATDAWNGKIDEVRMYKRVLEPREIAALYNWAPGPVGYWNLDERSGTTANDKSGSDNAGTLISNPTWSPGKFGSGVSTTNGDGNASRVIITDPASGVLDFTDSQNYTISGWVKTSASESVVDIVAKGEINQASETGYGISLSSSDDKAQCKYIDGNGSGTDEASSTTLLRTSGLWYHITCVMDRSGTAIGQPGLHIFINGIKEGSDTSLTEGSAANSSALRFGEGSSLREIEGTVDEVRIYNYARTPAQIIEDMNGGHPLGSSPVGSQVAYWQFDEGYGTTTQDTNINSLDGTLNNMASPGTSTSGWTNSGKFDKALNFDGSNDYVSVADNAALKLGINSYALSVWIKRAVGISGDEFILSKNGAGGSDEYDMFIRSTGIINCRIGVGATLQSQSSVSLADGNWHHVICNVNRSGYGQIYVDGKPSGTAIDLTAVTDNLTDTASLEIGRRPIGGYFNGTIDEVKIYAAALTPEQILIDYNQGQSTVMGALSTAPDGTTADWSSAREYCVPGDTATCDPPVGEWKLDERAGTTANDTSGNDNSGTLTNGLTWKAGKFGSAISTTNGDGNASHISITDPASGILDFTDSQDYTLSAWIKNSASENVVDFLAKGDITQATGTAYGITLSSTDNKAKCRYIDGNGSGTDEASSTTTIRHTGDWYHISCIMDRSGGSTGQAGLHIFINGVKEGSDTTLTEGSAANSSSLRIGEGSALREMEGSIDQVRIYNYARTPAQIAWDYNRGAPAAHYQFNECQGTTAYNAAATANEEPAGNNGTITIGSGGTNTSAGTCTGVSGEAWKDGANGKFGASLEFDGSDDYVSTASTISGFDQSSNFTLSAWVKTTTSFQRSILSNRNSVGLFWGISSSKPFIFFNGASPTTFAGNKTVDDGNWHLLTFIRSGTTSYHYVDGLLDSSLIQTGVPTNTQTMRIAYDIANSTYFTGQIDDVRIYNYALTSKQVELLYNENSTVRFGPITGSP
jgi:hypothetical protein